jgi:ribose transport system permease protein
MSEVANRRQRVFRGPLGGVTEISPIAAPVSEPIQQPRSSTSSMYLLVPILLFFLLLLVAVLRSPRLVAASGIGSAIIVAVPLILATYALMASTLSGRGTVDLSIGPLIGFINVTLIQIHGAGGLQSPAAFILYAIAAGVAYQILMGLIIVYVRVQPIIVALSGYLALSGINLVILPRPGGTAPDWMQSWGSGDRVFSPVFIILLLATAAWIAFTRTAFYGHLRLMGSDERAAYTSGVRITIVRLGAHVISGVFAALSAICFTALIGSGDPNQGTRYTLVAVTALVLGGANLSGGRGSVIGSLLGAVNIYLITYALATFSFGAVQSFVTDLCYGVILVLSLLITVALPHLQSRLRYVSPLLFFVALSVVILGVILHVTYDYSSVSIGQNAAPLASAAPPFVFETVPATVGGIVAPIYVRAIVFSAIVLLAIPALLRALVLQSGLKSLSPVVFIVVAGALLLGIYAVRHPDRLGALLGPAAMARSP